MIRPGEVSPANAPVPVVAVSRRETVRILNRGRFPVYLGSHFPIVQASSALEFDRSGLEGARLNLPSGATVRIAPGDELTLEVIWT